MPRGRRFGLHLQARGRGSTPVDHGPLVATLMKSARTVIEPPAYSAGKGSASPNGTHADAVEYKVNILIVDDRPEKLLALEACLSTLNQNLVRARSGNEALKCLLKDEFAVILLDVSMPGMDGFETATLIRQRPKTQHVPI